MKKQPSVLDDPQFKALVSEKNEERRRAVDQAIEAKRVAYDAVCDAEWSLQQAYNIHRDSEAVYQAALHEWLTIALRVPDEYLDLPALREAHKRRGVCSA